MEEIILVIFQFILECVGEGVIGAFFEIIAEILGHSVKGSFNKKSNPILAGMGYSILGALAGCVSLYIFPHGFIQQQTLRIIGIIVAPLLAASATVAIGLLRARKGQTLIRLDKFGYAYIFALSIALIRFGWAK